MKIVSYDPSKDQEFTNFVEEIKKNESERAQAIICHAYVEDLLKELLKKRLINYEPFLARLKDKLAFNHTLTLCYITGIITEAERKDIEFIVKIRNRFAHNRKIRSFNEEKIPEFCNGLRTPESLKEKLTSQEKFIKNAVYYIQILNLKLKYAKKVRFVEDESPDLKALDSLYM